MKSSWWELQRIQRSLERYGRGEAIRQGVEF